MDASALAHCVTHIYGERVSLVDLSKSDKDSIKQTYRYMDEGPELDALLAQKAKKDEDKLRKAKDNKATELALIEAQLSTVAKVISGQVQITDPTYATTPEGYMLLHVPNDPIKLEQALKAKEIAIKALRTQKKEHEVDNAESTPAFLYYKYNKLELKRLDKDKTADPFLGTTGPQKRKRHDSVSSLPEENYRPAKR